MKVVWYYRNIAKVVSLCICIAISMGALAYFYPWCILISPIAGVSGAVFALAKWKCWDFV